jgi:hypothetical protein
MTSIGGIMVDRHDPRQVAIAEVTEILTGEVRRLGYTVTSIDADFEGGTVTVKVNLTGRPWPPPGGVKYPEGVKLTREEPEVKELSIPASWKAPMPMLEPAEEEPAE